MATAAGYLGQGLGQPVGASEQAAWEVDWTTLAVLVFNLFDGLFTLSFLQLGLAEELNPLMRLAYQSSPLWFMLTKLTIVQGGVLVLAGHREHPIARKALAMGMCLYGAIVAYHFAFLLQVWVK